MPSNAMFFFSFLTQLSLITITAIIAHGQHVFVVVVRQGEMESLYINCCILSEPHRKISLKSISIQHLKIKS